MDYCIIKKTDILRYITGYPDREVCNLLDGQTHTIEARNVYWLGGEWGDRLLSVPVSEQGLSLEKYIVNKDAAILFWSDGDKIVVKRMKGDIPNKRMAFLYAYFQKTCGMSKTQANKFIDRVVEDED